VLPPLYGRADYAHLSAFLAGASLKVLHPQDGLDDLGTLRLRKLHEFSDNPMKATIAFCLLRTFRKPGVLAVELGLQHTQDSRRQSEPVRSPLCLRVCLTDLEHQQADTDDLGAFRLRES
jgi:hypothetical protein